MKEIKKYEVIIIGGSYAGLSAAMGLGRAIRKVLIIDDGKPCNRQTPHSHNFLTQDGKTPAAITALGKFQVLAYPTVHWVDDFVTEVTGNNNHFTVLTKTGDRIEAKKLVFTTGIKDLIPDIEGFKACWGISVIHCPYCHGYEYRDQPTGILANGDIAFEMGRLIRNWTSQLTVFTNGSSTLSKEQHHQLSGFGINISEKSLLKIEHDSGYLQRIKFSDNTDLTLSALYARLPFLQHCEIPQKIGCSLNDAGYIQVDESQRTTVPGIYAAGDNTSMMRSVSMAVANGSKSAAMINHEFISETLSI